jgi:hypothetical protein
MKTGKVNPVGTCVARTLKITLAGLAIHPLSLTLVATLLLAAGGVRAHADDANPSILPPNSRPYGKTYGQWEAAHWQWLYSLQVASNPLFKDGNVDLSLSQPPGPVWFLGGTFSTTPGPGGPVNLANRTGTVPAGKALFFPIIDFEIDNAVPPPGTNTTFTTAELRAQAKAVMDGASGITCTIDGVAVNNLANVLTTPYRVTTPVFNYRLPATDNVDQFFGANISGLITGAVADGVSLMLAPLPPGQHTIHFTGAIPSFSFALDITYNITVTPSSDGNADDN